MGSSGLCRRGVRVGRRRGRCSNRTSLGLNEDGVLETGTTREQLDEEGLGRTDWGSGMWMRPKEDSTVDEEPLRKNWWDEFER